jgi:hypothetical protein
MGAPDSDAPTRVAAGPRDRRRFGGAIALGFAAVAAAAAVLILSDPFDRDPLSASVALDASVAAVQPAGEDLLQVTVYNSRTGREHAVGEADAFIVLAWSPRGDKIAALAIKEGFGQVPRLHLIDGSSGEDTIVPLSVEADSTFVSWAPDGTRLAVTGTRMYIVSQDGVVLSETSAPGWGGPDSSVQISGGFAWSPDSRLFGFVVNGVVIVADESGNAALTPLEDAIPAAVGDNAAVLGWKNDELIIEVAVGQGAKHFKVHLGPGGLESVAAAPGESLPRPAGAVNPDPDLFAEAREAVPGGDVVRQRLSADLAADVVEMRSVHENGSVLGAPVAIVVRHRDSGVTIAVPVSTTSTRGGWLYDVFAYTREQ